MAVFRRPSPAGWFWTPRADVEEQVMQQMICTGSFMWDAGKFVHAGAVYYDDSPIVRKYGMFFRPVEFADDGRMMVEQTTAAPGERRLVQRALAVIEPDPEPEPVVEAERSGRPWVTASKEEWTAYAVSIGVDPEGLTKSQLLDAVDEREKLTVGD